MQLSQLYRRGVLRPLDESAAEQLAAFKISYPIRAEWLPILSDVQFADIWEAGVLQRINDACGIALSDYEEVELAARNIGRALQAMRSRPVSNASIATFFQGLEALLSDAMANNKNVYFVL